MRAEIITVGTEIIIGDIVDSNSQYISKKMSQIGIDVFYHTSVGDNSKRLKAVFATAFKKADIVILVGGLGPTMDDLTKETITDILQLRPALNGDAYDNFKRFYQKRGLEIPSDQEKQYIYPSGAVLFPNEIGTACGCSLESDKKTIILLPGVPQEMELMLDKYVVPYLSKKSGETIVSRHIKITRYTESQVEDALSDIINNANPTVGIYAKNSYVEVRITAKAESEEKAESMIMPYLTAIRNTFQTSVFNDSSLSFEEEIVRQLKNKSMTISICESCTGGLLASKITSVSGASMVMEYAQTTYSNDKKNIFADVSKNVLKENGAVSEEAAGQMAIGTRFKTKSSIAVSITGIAGPQGGSPQKPVGTVYIAVSNKEDIIIKQFNFKNIGREAIREAATINAMIMVKMFLNSLKVKDSEIYKVKDFMKKTKQTLKTSIGKGALMYRILNIFLIAVIAISVWEIGKYAYESVSNFLLQRKMESGYGKDTGIELPPGYLRDFAYLYGENEDVKGYLKVNGTKVNYPIVQGNDNQYYLRNDFYKNRSKYGTVFFDYRNDIKDRDVNTIVYGHNMNDGQMFNDLLKYKEVDFFKEHPTLQMDTVYEKGTYDIFAVLMTNVSPNQGDVFDYTTLLDYNSKKQFNNFIEGAKKRSYINVDLDVSYGDEILTLSTCDDIDFYHSRFVVLAKRRKDGEQGANIQNSSQNNNVLMPQQWYRVNGEKVPDISEYDASAYENISASTDVQEDSPTVKDMEKYENVVNAPNTPNFDPNFEQQQGIDPNIEFSPETAPPSLSQPDPTPPPDTPKPNPTPPPPPNVNGGDVNGDFVFTTYGYGHGVGMSQYGANEYAKKGYSYERILRHYYTNIDISTVNAKNEQLTVSANGSAKTGDISYITAGIAQAEMGSSFKKEALLAQLVAAHTFVKNANNKGSVPYVPFRTPTSKMLSFAKSVENKVITYGGNVVYTPYFAMSSGMTQSSSDMWGGNYPWLVPVDSSVDRNIKRPTYYMNYKNEYKISAVELKDKLERVFGVSLSNTPKNWFRDIVKNASGYVLSINLDGQKTIKGRYIREKVFTTQSFKSHAFDVKYI